MSSDPEQHHFLESRASSAVRRAIHEHAAVVWERIRLKLNCLEASIWWHQVFQRESIPSELHGRVGGSESGGYLNSNGGVDNHVFVVVGAERALFDATYTQLLDDPPWAIGRYLVETGQALPEWRALEGRSGPLLFVPAFTADRRFWERGV
jgi:hypothetical protein